MSERKLPPRGDAEAHRAHVGRADHKPVEPETVETVEPETVESK